jgi:hypothetical protein
LILLHCILRNGSTLRIPRVRFGAAITLTFDRECRPVKDNAMSVAVAVLLESNDEERDRVLRRADALLDKVKSKVFCAVFEGIVSMMEESEKFETPPASTL